MSMIVMWLRKSLILAAVAAMGLSRTAVCQRICPVGNPARNSNAGSTFE